MQTITIDILNKNAVRLLQDLELLNLILMHNEKTEPAPQTNWAVKYKGAMTKQPLTEIDKQLNDLRSGC